MPSTRPLALVALVASSALALPTGPESRPIGAATKPVSSREVDNTNELDERFFFLGPLISMGVRAGVQAGVRAGVRKGAQAAAKHGAKKAAKHGNNNNDNNKNKGKGKKHKRDLEEEEDLDVRSMQDDELDGRSVEDLEDLTEIYSRELLDTSSVELHERFFFLAPLIAHGVRAGVQAGIRAGVRKGAQAAAKHGAKHGANHNNNNRGKKHKRDLEDVEEDELMMRSVWDDELDMHVGARAQESLEELD